MMRKMFFFRKNSVIFLLVVLGLMVGFNKAWAQKKPIVLKISHQAFPMETFIPATTAHWAKLVKERTKGEVEMQFFYDTLGKGPAILTSAQQGVADGFSCVSSLLTTRVKALNVMEVDTYAVPEKYPQLVKAIRPVMEKIFAEQGLQYAGAMYTYAGVVYTHHSRFFKKPEDFKGQKLRMPGSWLTKIVADYYGGVPVNILPPEMYSSAQRKIIDGVATIIMLVDAFKLYEVQKYITEMPGANGTLVCYGLNMDVFKKLDKNVQDIIIQAGKDAEAFSWDYGRKEEETLRKKLSKVMNYHVLTAEEFKPFEAINEKVAPEVVTYSGPLGKELAEAIMKVKKSK
jgi:TRAP-type C4-dicarboxylate transport system substrate-binding protein